MAIQVAVPSTPLSRLFFPHGSHTGGCNGTTYFPPIAPSHAMSHPWKCSPQPQLSFRRSCASRSVLNSVSSIISPLTTANRGGLLLSLCLSPNFIYTTCGSSHLLSHLSSIPSRAEVICLHVPLSLSDWKHWRVETDQVLMCLQFSSSQHCPVRDVFLTHGLLHLLQIQIKC